MDSLETRRLFAFTASPPASITGVGYQSVDKIVTLPNDGYIVAGTFSTNTSGISSPLLKGDDESNLFFRLVTNTRTSTQTLGSDGGGKLKFKDDRADFASLPRRVDDVNVPLGVSSAARRADQYVTQMKIGPDGKLYVSVVFKQDLSLNAQNPRARVLHPDDSFEKNFYDSAILRYNISSGKFVLDNIQQIGGPFNDVIQDFAFDASNNIFITGSFERGCDFDTSRRVAIYNPSGRGDAFVVKYDAVSGKLRFFLAVRQRRRPAISGSTRATRSRSDQTTAFISAAPSPARLTSASTERSRIKKLIKADDETDGFTMRLNKNGSLNWVRAQGGGDFDGIRAVTTTTDGGVYSVGCTSATKPTSTRGPTASRFSKQTTATITARRRPICFSPASMPAATW